MSSLRLELRSKNANLWHSVYDNGGSMKEFCRDHPGITYQCLVNYVNLKKSPYMKSRPEELQRSAKRIVAAIGKPQLWVFPPDLYARGPIPVLVAEISPAQLASPEEMLALPSPALDPEELCLEREERSLSDRISRGMSTLSPNEQRVLRMRFGLEPHSRRWYLSEVSETLGVSRERVRQIEAFALRKMRHPFRSRELRA